MKNLDVDSAYEAMRGLEHPFIEDYNAALHTLGVFDRDEERDSISITNAAFHLIYLLIERVKELEKKIGNISKNHCTQCECNNR